jgi:catechol 2,3-dioxygenase-like lactoylglutathione lyase family enzyme
MESLAGFGPVTPVIPALDVARSLAFYVDILGFEEVFRSGNPADYVGIRCGLATLHIFACTEPTIAEWTALRIAVSDIESLFAHCEASGIVHPNGTLAVQPWGSRDFTVLDPSGVGITFWEQTP